MKKIHEIDKFRLDEEWVEQPALYVEYAERLAEQMKRLDYAKSDLELTVAEIDKDIRLYFQTKYGLEKLTENVVSNTIILQPRYQVALKALNETKHDVAILRAAVDGLDQRKSALENLVKLFLSSYFAQPQAPREAKEAMEDAGKQSFADKTKPKKRPCKNMD